MKFVHLSDLHIGKRVNEFSMIEDQKYILEKILDIIDDEQPDGVFIAGDIYDKPVPSAEAVQLFDDFLVELSGKNMQVFVISGNHDSAERIAFGSRLMDKSGIHMSPVYDGNIAPVLFEDEYGTVEIYMLPFLKPANVRRFYQDEQIDSYTDAMSVVIKNMLSHTRDGARKILIAHQFVAGASRCESEELSVGGIDNVEPAVFEGFDYVALGHIHGAQHIGRETVRYAGTPLKYSFSEVSHEKSVTIVELAEAGNGIIRTVPLVPMRDLIKIKGTFEEISSKSFYEKINRQDYIYVTLTDEEDVPDVLGKLRMIFPNLMRIDYDNKRTRAGVHYVEGSEVHVKSPLQLFEEFYETQNGQEMSENQKSLLKELIDKIWEGNA